MVHTQCVFELYLDVRVEASVEVVALSWIGGEAKRLVKDLMSGLAVPHDLEAPDGSRTSTASMCVGARPIKCAMCSTWAVRRPCRANMDEPCQAAGGSIPSKARTVGAMSVWSARKTGSGSAWWNRHDQWDVNALLI